MLSFLQHFKDFIGLFQRDGLIVGEKAHQPAQRTSEEIVQHVGHIGAGVLLLGDERVLLVGLAVGCVAYEALLLKDEDKC